MVESTLGGVVIQTPDPTKYQGLDELQSRVLGNRGTVIPSSSEARKAPPNKIFIDATDPLTGEGGIVVDLNNIDEETKAAAIAAANETYSGEDAVIAAFEIMQASQNDETTEEVVEAVEETQAVDDIIPDKVITTEPAAEAQPTDMTSIVAQQGQMLSLMTQMVQELKSPKEEPQIKKETPVEPETAEVEDTTEPVGELMPKREAVDLLNDAFDALKIPGLQPIAAKPKFRVIFNLGDAGTHTAWYHWVGTHSNGLFLIYDTRFEYGMQYVPPTLGVGRSIRVDIPDNDASYNVYSLDFVHPFGVFDIVNLVIAEEPVSSKPNQTMTDAMSPEYNDLDDDLLKHIM